MSRTFVTILLKPEGHWGLEGLCSLPNTQVSQVAQWKRTRLLMQETQETWVRSLGSGRSPGGGNGNPLRDSCLENPMDRGTWWATVRGVAKSWTRLKRLSRLITSLSWHVAGQETGSPGFRILFPGRAAVAALLRILLPDGPRMRGFVGGAWGFPEPELVTGESRKQRVWVPGGSGSPCLPGPIPLSFVFRACVCVEWTRFLMHSRLHT